MPLVADFIETDGGLVSSPSFIRTDTATGSVGLSFVACMAFITQLTISDASVVGIDSVTYGSKSMTKVVSLAGDNGGTTFFFEIAWFVAAAPVSSGLQTITYDFSSDGTTDEFVNIVARGYTGGGVLTDQNSKISSGTPSFTASMALNNSDSDGFHLDAHFASKILTVVAGSGQSELFSGLGGQVKVSEKAGAPTNTLSWDFSGIGGSTLVNQLGISLVDVAEGIELTGPRDIDPPDPESLPPWDVSINIPWYPTRGILFPNPYFTTKTNLQIANLLNNVRIY